MGTEKSMWITDISGGLGETFRILTRILRKGYYILSFKFDVKGRPGIWQLFESFH